MKVKRPNRFFYSLTRTVSRIAAALFFRPRILRNELKGKKGACLIIANHQAAYDFINLIGAVRRPMHFVVSESFYRTLPFTGIMDRIGVIPKQQFQTTLADLKRMRAVLDAGRPLVIYPAGLMCEDGRSTPLPEGTFQFLQWARVDVYMAKTVGTYFAMPKWAKKKRPGRTYLDLYRLFSKEELAAADLDTVRKKAEDALLFDAYREQEERRIRYRGCSNVEGLEYVLYQCPRCHAEHTVTAREDTLRCTACGYTARCDEYGFLHGEEGVEPALRYVSDWSRLIFEQVKQTLKEAPALSLSCRARLLMIDQKKHAFTDRGEVALTLSRDGFLLRGTADGEPFERRIPIDTFASLPFSPSRYFEIQDGRSIYRCAPHDGRSVMKYINMVKALYELRQSALEASAKAEQK